MEEGFDETLPNNWKHDPQTKGPTNMEVGDNSSATEEPSDLDEEKTPATEAAPKRKELPLRLYYGYGPRIHRQLSIEYGVANKRCENCGEVGQLTCFSGSFRKWALRRVTEEEKNQLCSRCNLRGHTCVQCDIPIRYRLDEVPRLRKRVRCGVCGEIGHNRRSCFRAA